MGLPTLTWSTSGILYNNAFVFDSSAPATHANGQSIPGIPITNYKKTRSITHDAGSGTEGSPDYVAPTTTTSYTSSNPCMLKNFTSFGPDI